MRFKSQNILLWPKNSEVTWLTIFSQSNIELVIFQVDVSVERFDNLKYLISYSDSCFGSAFLPIRAVGNFLNLLFLVDKSERQ